MEFNYLIIYFKSRINLLLIGKKFRINKKEGVVKKRKGN